MERHNTWLQWFTLIYILYTLDTRSLLTLCILALDTDTNQAALNCSLRRHSTNYHFHCRRCCISLQCRGHLFQQSNLVGITWHTLLSSAQSAVLTICRISCHYSKSATLSHTPFTPPVRPRLFLGRPVKNNPADPAIQLG